MGEKTEHTFMRPCIDIVVAEDRDTGDEIAIGVTTWQCEPDAFITEVSDGENLLAEKLTRSRADAEAAHREGVTVAAAMIDAIVQRAQTSPAEVVEDQSHAFAVALVSQTLGLPAERVEEAYRRNEGKRKPGEDYSEASYQLTAAILGIPVQDIKAVMARKIAAERRG